MTVQSCLDGGNAITISLKGLINLRQINIASLKVVDIFNNLIKCQATGTGATSKQIFNVIIKYVDNNRILAGTRTATAAGEIVADQSLDVTLRPVRHVRAIARLNCRERGLQSRNVCVQLGLKLTKLLLQSQGLARSLCTILVVQILVGILTRYERSHTDCH